MSNTTTTYPTLRVAPCRTCDGKGTMREGFPERDWPCRECRGSKLDYREAFRAACYTTRKAIREGHTDPEGIACDALDMVRDGIRAEVKRKAESHAETWADGESVHDDVYDYTHEAADQSRLVFITHLSHMVALLAEDEDHEQAAEYGKANDGSIVTTLAYCVMCRHIQEAIEARAAVEPVE